MDTAILKIASINFLLSADATLLVAAASRALPSWKLKFFAVFLGVAAIVALQIVSSHIVIYLIGVPYFSVTAALLLLWLAIRILLKGPRTLGNALLVMIGVGLLLQVVGIQNSFVINTVAKSDYLLIATGLAASMPVLLLVGWLLVACTAKRAEPWAIAILFLLAGLYFAIRGPSSNASAQLAGAAICATLARIWGAPVVASAAVAIAGAIAGGSLFDDYAIRPLLGNFNWPSWSLQALGAVIAVMIAWSARAYRNRTIPQDAATSP